jgi:hypothetical protein
VCLQTLDHSMSELVMLLQELYSVMQLLLRMAIIRIVVFLIDSELSVMILMYLLQVMFILMLVEILQQFEIISHSEFFQGSAGENPFPYEYRDWTHLTTLTITIPKGYAYNPNTATITLNRTAGDDNIVTPNS